MTIALIIAAISIGLSIFGLAYATVISLEFRKFRKLREAETDTNPIK